MSTSNVELRNHVPLFSVTQPNVDLRNITSECYLNSVRGIIGLLLNIPIRICITVSAGLGAVEAPGQQYYRKYIYVMSISIS